MYVHSQLIACSVLSLFVTEKNCIYAPVMYIHVNTAMYIAVFKVFLITPVNSIVDNLS